MISEIIIGVGTRFQRYDPILLEWENIAEIKGLDGPDTDKEYIENITLDTTGGYGEIVGGMLDAGMLALSMNFTRASYKTMADDFDDDDTHQYRILLQDDSLTTINFTGLVMDLDLDVEISEIVSSDTVIQITGGLSITDSDIPTNALLNSDGTAITNSDGSYILIGD